MSMNIETKTVRGEISDYLRFGWKHTEDVRRGHARHHYTESVLARDKDMQNYRLIAALEAKYFSLKAQKKVYEPMDPLWGIISFLCLIVPFIIYAAVKSSQKSKIEEENARLQREMNKVLKEVAPLL